MRKSSGFKGYVPLTKSQLECLHDYKYFGTQYSKQPYLCDSASGTRISRYITKCTKCDKLSWGNLVVGLDLKNVKFDDNFEGYEIK